MVLDPLYFLLLAPGLLLALWAQWRTQSAFSQGKEVPAARGLTGAEAAAEVLRAGGVSRVAVEPVEPLGPPELVSDLLGCHAEAGIQLRVLDNLWPFWDAVITSTVGFSGIRLANARGRPQ